MEFPSNAKKKELLQIFAAKIGPKQKPKSVASDDVIVLDDSDIQSPKPSEKTKKSSIATPSKAAPSSAVSSATKSSSRKRKAIHSTPEIKFSDSPSKGNVFEVESDSESDILSPKKKPKHSATSTPLKLGKSPQATVTTPLPDKIAKVKTPKSKTPKSETKAKAEEESSESSAIPSSPSVTTQVSPEVANQSLPAELSDLPAEEPEAADASKSWQNSFQTASSVADHSEDTAQSFDSALKKLRKDDDHLKSEVHDADLARLLGLDVGCVKPKLKARRVVSPRNPIIIPKKRLEYKEELSEEEFESEEDKVSEKEEESEEDGEENEDESDAEDDADGVDLHEISVAEAKADPSTSPRPKSRGSIGKSLLWAILHLLAWSLLAGTTLFAYWYREQTFLVGYCGQEINKTTIPKTPDTPDFLVSAGAYLDQNFKPQCVECPQHARCFPNLEIGCYDDFVEFTPWYFNYMPIVDPHLKKCVSDTKRAEKIEIMIDVALDLLRARNANKNCGRLPEEDVEAGISVADLHDLLLAMKAPYITTEEFEELWKRSVVELEKEPEIIVRQVTVDFHSHPVPLLTPQVRFSAHNVHSPVDTNDTVAEENSTYKVLRSTSLSHISLKCQLSNTMVSVVMKFQRVLAVFVVVAVAGLAVRWKYNQLKLYQRQVDTLYKEVLSKLQRQARLSKESTELPAYIGSIQLRDLILSDEKNLAFKMRLWEGVSRKVDRNTNVKHQLLEIHGEVMKVWQWISQIE